MNVRIYELRDYFKSVYYIIRNELYVLTIFGNTYTYPYTVVTDDAYCLI